MPIEIVSPTVVAVEPIVSEAGKLDMLNGDTTASALFPSLTTVLILLTFVMTVYQLYRYVKRMMLGAKGGRSTDFESF